MKKNNIKLFLTFLYMSETLFDEIKNIVSNTNNYWTNENANKDNRLSTIQRDHIAGAVSTYMTREILPQHIVKAHDDGIIHFHDMDYFIQNVLTNCELINLRDIFENGTIINNVYIETPHTLTTAMTIAVQVIQNTICSTYGGATITLSHFAPFVNLEDKKEITQAVQSFNYQITTSVSNSGTAMFLSVFMYINERPEYVKETAALIEEFLKQRLNGLKNEDGMNITQAFPKLLYLLDENNINETAEYYYLTKLAAESTAKRMNPDYISGKIMKERKGDIYPCMGCVDSKSVITYKLNDELYVESFGRAWNRVLKTFQKEIINVSECSSYMNVENNNMTIYDTKLNDFVNVKKMIKNRSTNWLLFKFTNGLYIKCTPDHPFYIIGKGRIIAENLSINDEIIVNEKQYTEENVNISEKEAWVLGFNTYDDLQKVYHHFPNDVFRWKKNAKLSFLTGLIDADGCINKTNKKIQLNSTNEELALQQYLLAKALNMKYVKIWFNKYKNEKLEKIIYHVEFKSTEELINKLVCHKKINIYSNKKTNKFEIKYKIKSIEKYNKDDFSYDVETESDFFEVNSIYSHNCRSFLTPDPINHKYYGRFNQGVVSLNLPDVAFSSNHNEKRFWELLDERLELCHEALRIKHEKLSKGNSRCCPLLWNYGVLSRLPKNSDIKPLLYNNYSTISLGYAGLYETVQYFKRCYDKRFGLDILTFINEKIQTWKNAENISYSLYGTPIESSTYKFAKCLKKRFGDDVFVKLDGHNRNYITNSYHVPVFQKIDPFEKLAFESEFEKLTPGGSVSYIEAANLSDNIDVVLEVIKFIYENIMYAEINIKSDYCFKCQKKASFNIIDENNMLIFECPFCKNRDRDSMYITRRTCGYIGTNNFNQGRMNDIKDRYVHIDNHNVDE